MKVWVVLDEGWEGSTLKGVFSTEEKAQEYIDHPDTKFFDSAEIEEVAVDSHDPAGVKRLLNRVRTHGDERYGETR